MEKRIAFLAPEHFIAYLRSLMEYYHMDLKKECQLDFYQYQSIAELPDLYRKVYQGYDGFCLPGNAGRKLLLEGTGDLPPKPIQALLVQSADYFKTFFQILRNDRAVQLSRVYLDHYFWLGDRVPKNVEEYMVDDRLVSDARSTFVSHMSVEQILKAEQEIAGHGEAAWRKGLADHIVCRFTSAYQALKAQGVPCSFVYPSHGSFYNTIRLLLNEIRMEQMRENLPAVLLLSTEQIQQGYSVSGISEENLNLQRCILEFDQKYTAGFVVNQLPSGFEIYTTNHMVKKITEQFTGCQLGQFIYSRLGLRVPVGYGIGQTVMQARMNAMEACNLARRGQKSYLLTEDGRLIGPLEGGRVLSLSSGEVSQELQQAAERSKLSCATIQRILSVVELMGREEMTTQDLANALQVTVANANRYLNALEQSGLAEICPGKKSYSKGRPSRIYRILIRR